MKIERKQQLNIYEFQEQYLVSNKPVIITDGMNGWIGKDLWTPEYFEKNFGNEKVQVYDDLFNLIDIITLESYFKTYFNSNTSNHVKMIPYVRWYTKLKDCDFVWADFIFSKIKEHWSLPYFLPNTAYVLPYCSSLNTINPANDSFPAKGLFISGKGARTRLHRDPWCSDAVLCQIFGKKRVILYAPEQGKYLYNGRNCVDIDNPDLDLFPDFLEAEPNFTDTLEEGEILFLPHKWFHHVYSISDSISLTWNFVHLSTGLKFLNYLVQNPPQEEMEVIKWFLEDISVKA